MPLVSDGRVFLSLRDPFVRQSIEAWLREHPVTEESAEHLKDAWRDGTLRVDRLDMYWETRPGWCVPYLTCLQVKQGESTGDRDAVLRAHIARRAGLCGYAYEQVVAKAQGSKRDIALKELRQSIVAELYDSWGASLGRIARVFGRSRSSIEALRDQGRLLHAR